MKATATVHDVRLAAPLRPAGGAPVPRPLVLFTVQDDDGFVGYGEAAPLESYDGVSVERVLGALAAHTSEIQATRELLSVSDVWAACAAADPLPQALAAVDLALWDLLGRRTEKPVAELLGVAEPGPVAVNATIAAVAPAEAAEEASRAATLGFSCLKVKVGTADDRQRLQAIRDAVGSDMLLRVDANGAWTQLDAPERLRALERFDIELFEEPVHGPGAIQAVAAAVPSASLAVDETARDAIGMLPRRACDSVCLKISDSGGITGLLTDAYTARDLRYKVYIASTLDGPLGIAAALHAAAVVQPDRHCGLATLDRFDRPSPLTAVGGHMHVPTGPGLGADLIDWYVE
jgi:L-alanine-DL-glutamate epimerase-like enolase superfamily enzyme